MGYNLADHHLHQEKQIDKEGLEVSDNRGMKNKFSTITTVFYKMVKLFNKL